MAVDLQQHLTILRVVSAVIHLDVQYIVLRPKYQSEMNVGEPRSTSRVGKKEVE